MSKIHLPSGRMDRKSAVMELASLGTAPTNFMMLMILTPDQGSA